MRAPVRIQNCVRPAARRWVQTRESSLPRDVLVRCLAGSEACGTCLRSLSHRGCRPCRARNDVSRPLIFADIGGNAATGERMRCPRPSRSRIVENHLSIASSSQKTGTSSYRTKASSRRTGTSSHRTGTSSHRTGASSRRTGASSRKTKASSHGTVARCRQTGGKSRKTQRKCHFQEIAVPFMSPRQNRTKPAPPLFLPKLDEYACTAGC